MAKIYRGVRDLNDWTDKIVTVEGGHYLEPTHLKHIEKHSPDGFEWGYGGSGPADLALSILTDFAGEEIGNRYYQDFKWFFVSKFEKNEWTLTSKEIEDWLKSLNEVKLCQY